MKNQIQNRPETVQYTFRIPVKLKYDLEKIAEKEDRSLSRQIVSVLRKFICQAPGLFSSTCAKFIFQFSDQRASC